MRDSSAAAAFPGCRTRRRKLDAVMFTLREVREHEYRPILPASGNVPLRSLAKPSSGVAPPGYLAARTAVRVPPNHPSHIFCLHESWSHELPAPAPAVI